MRFQIEQRINGPVDDVARLYTERRFYDRLGELPKLGQPEVVDRRTEDGLVHLSVRFRFTGHLAPAVTKVVDPAKLSWVEESVHDLAHHRVTFRLRPDNYADRLRSEGSSRFEPAADGGTRRITEGDVVVKVPLLLGGGRVAQAVEGAIISGLRDHLTAEVQVVERLLQEN